jgi:hypothetical protein
LEGSRRATLPVTRYPEAIAMAGIGAALGFLAMAHNRKRTG